MYEWDEEKNQDNLANHGLSFEDAKLVLSGPCVNFDDDRFDYDEDRYLTLGLLQGRVVLIAYTWREDRIRIISMRKAMRREQEIYQK
ncbi:MAG: BrnT family toxin [Candidatus Tectomicrobia bacterium]|nr:BrnT family toxin [Candidatus Tectomicrobia bacterium]